MSGRKGQITIFMIIGLILLVSASMVMYLNTIKKVDILEDVIVPPEIKPIYDYVANCLYTIGTDALVLIGTQGGYTDLSEDRIDTRDITLTPSAYLKIDPSNTLKLPLWFYEGEERVPSIEFIQKELADYVNNHLGNCIDDFSAFSPQFEIEELEIPRISSILTDEDVVIRMNYPIEIKQGERTIDHSEFMVNIPIRLKKLWELAKAIMEEENEKYFLETLTIDLMAMDEKIPMDGFEFRCGTMIWKLDDVEQELQRILRYNLPRIRVKGTDYPAFLADESVYETLSEYDMEDIQEGRYPPIAAPADAYEYRRMMIDPEVANAQDIKVSFTYLPRWGIDLNALPNEAGMLRSNNAPGQNLLSFICMNSFHFTYDVIYPVQVRLRDPLAYDDRGYTFNFAFPVLIDNNEPNRESFGVRLFNDFFIDTSFCEQPGGETIEVRAIGQDDEGYTISAGLRDVNISYQCINKRCMLGQTGYSTSAPGRYALVTSLPPGCTNPILGASKEGYLNARKQLTGDTLDIEMTKLRKMSIKVVKHTYLKQTKTLDTSSSELGKGDQVSIFVKLRNNPSPLDQYFIYEFNQNETQYLELVDGNAEYDFDIMLHNFDKFVGGYKVRNVSIKYNEFVGYNEIVLHVFEFRPRPIGDDATFEMITYYMGSKYTNTLKPTFR